MQPNIAEPAHNRRRTSAAAAKPTVVAVLPMDAVGDEVEWRAPKRTDAEKIRRGMARIVRIEMFLGVVVSLPVSAYLAILFVGQSRASGGLVLLLGSICLIASESNLLHDEKQGFVQMLIEVTAEAGRALGLD
eukprot:COSAG01_NODE_1621_length_9711_cov_55.630292_8_plen_133_part_00